jgi:para-nitrobenzyl esterase
MTTMALWRVLSALPVCVLLASSGASAAGSQLPRVRANGEVLVGAWDDRVLSVAVFRGIPFAAPPVGQLRWRAPEPHRARPGIQSAQDFAAGCYQDDYNAKWYRRVAAAFGEQGPVIAEPAFSEDCLFLNVWSPRSDKDHRRRPVMVWIHGGSNKSGWSFEPNYRAGALAARGDVVVVTVAYRLGVFGYFGHPDSHGQGRAVNFGLLDQIAALRWIHRNIDAFGGDPGNVTILGESAGGANVGYLLISPPARPLFRRAIAQSGGYLMSEEGGREYAEAVGAALSSSLPGRPSLEALRRVPAAEVFKAASDSLGEHDWRPVIDGSSLRASPAKAYARDGIAHDLLVGSNENESYMYVDGDVAAYETELATLPDRIRARVALRGAQEPDTHRAHDQVSTLLQMGCPPYLMAHSAARSGHRAFVYRFTRVRPWPGGAALLAYHGSEIPYVFDTHDAWLSADAYDTALTSEILGYWARFARSGDPNAEGHPWWPTYRDTAAQVMELGTHIAARAAPDHDLCKGIAPDAYPGWAD